MRLRSGLRMSVLGAVAVLLSTGFSVAADSPKPDKAFLGVDLSKGHALDFEYHAPGDSLAGKTIVVKPFVMKAEKPRKGECDLDWDEAGKFLANAFVKETNDHLKSTKFTEHGPGDYTLEGQITEYGCPKRGAAWGGWIGELGGQGGITFDMKIVDKSGKVIAAAHHRIMVGASYSMTQRVKNVWNDKIVDFVEEQSK
jgi:hypothetical protein